MCQRRNKILKITLALRSIFLPKFCLDNVDFAEVVIHVDAIDALIVWLVADAITCSDIFHSVIVLEKPSHKGSRFRQPVINKRLQAFSELRIFEVFGF